MKESNTDIAEDQWITFMKYDHFCSLGYWSFVRGRARFTFKAKVIVRVIAHDGPKDSKRGFPVKTLINHSKLTRL